MKLQSGYRYRLEPTATQAVRLRQYAGACRWTWNHFLHWREDAYLSARTTGGMLPSGAFGYAWMCRELTVLRRQIPWLQAVPISALQQVVRDLDKAYGSFFAGTHRFPTHKARHKGNAWRVIAPRDVQVDGDWVRLPKLGWVRLRLSRKIPGRIVNASVSQEGPHWFVSFSVEHEIADPVAPTGEPIGIDAGIAHSLALSTGQMIAFAVPSAEENAFVGRLQRQTSRKVKGSRRWRKAQDRVARHRRHFAARRRDQAHKASTELARAHREIHVEALKLRNMTASAKGTLEEPGRNVRQKAGLNRSMLAQAHSEFVRLIGYKCERTGSKLVKKNPRHTSQQCEACGHIAPENRPEQALFRCSKCGHEAHADINAARNILQSKPAGGPPVAARGRIGHKAPVETRTHPRSWKTSTHRRESAAIPLCG